jgi:ABC-type uncharacterized transport system ATPase component
MQVSFSETFCITAADSVASGVPTVGSHAIRWLAEESQASTISVNAITQSMHHALRHGEHLIRKNLGRLQEDAEQSKQAWLSAIRHLT